MRFLYKITNKINGKIYIGQTNDFKSRMFDHKKPSNDSIIGRAINKYGWNNFEAKILAECSDDIIDRMEIASITFFNSLVPSGYNLDAGGTLNKQIHPDVKEILRQKAIIQFSKAENRAILSKRAKGRNASEETKRKISIAGKGRFQSEETRKKRSLSMTGKTVSDHAKSLISAANKGRVLSQEVRKEMSKIHIELKLKNFIPVSSKFCPTCKREKAVSDFFTRKTKSGIPSVKYQCKVCHGKDGVRRKKIGKIKLMSICIIESKYAQGDLL